jgi:hypothetical protein
MDRYIKRLACGFVGVVIATALVSAPNAFAQELDAQLPTEEGWRGIRWGTTVEDVAKAFGASFAEDKRSAKDKTAKVAQRGHLKSKVRLDGFEYEVTLGFNPSERLNAVTFTCQKPTKEHIDEVRQRFLRQFGETHGRDREYSVYVPEGVRIDPGIAELLTWRQDSRIVSLNRMEVRPNAFQTVRRMLISVVTHDTEDDFGVKGYRSFVGEILWSRTERDTRFCALSVSPVAKSVRVSCGNKGELQVELDLAKDPVRFQLGPAGRAGSLAIQSLTIVRNGSEPIRLSVASDIIDFIRQSFPDHVQ